MNRKGQPQAPAAATPIVPAAAKRRRFGRRLAWGLAVAVIGAGLWFGGRQAIMVARVRAGLPATPDLTGKPAILGERLATAQAQARSWLSPLAGVADLGRIYHVNGYDDDAEACWRLLRVSQPREARWAYYLADLRRTASDYPAMAELLGETVRLAPGYAPAWLQLGNYQLKTGQTEAAARSFQRRLGLLPADPYARLGLVRLALLQHRAAEARRLVEQLLQDSPQFSTGHNLYAEMLAAAGDEAAADRQRWLGRETGRFRDADDPWLEALQPWCFDFERLCVWGTVEFQTDHGDRGQTMFERAIRLRPDDPAGYEYLATLELKLGHADRARALLEQGLTRHLTRVPSPMYFINLSHAYRVLKRPADAVRVAREGLARCGSQFELYDALGAALGDFGRPQEAVTALQEAVRLNPNDSNANYNLALALLAVGLPDEAVAAVKHTLVLQPTYPNALLFLGRMEMDQKHWDAAARYLQPLYESHPEMPESRQMMALWHLRLGEAAEARSDQAAAERHYRAGLAIAPSLAELQVSLGVLLLVQGRMPEALGPLEAYHQLAPKNPQSCLFLGQVYAATGRIADARRLLEEGAKLADQAGNAGTAQNCRKILREL